MPTPPPVTTDNQVATRDARVLRYLDHVRFEKRLADRTITLYGLDLDRLEALARAVPVDLTAVHSAHVRRWVAQMHAQGRSARGIALILSGWRGFYAWLAREGVLATNPVQGVRPPKGAKPLPKALNVDQAVQLADHVVNEDDPALEARDAAIVELLYGSGLRVAELVGLDVHDSAQARGWLDLAAGQAHVLGKGSKRRSVPLGAVAVTAVAHWLGLRSSHRNSMAYKAFGSNGLLKKSFMPAARHWCLSSSKALAVMAMMGRSGPSWARIARVAPRPSIRGICMSISTSR